MSPEEFNKLNTLDFDQSSKLRNSVEKEILSQSFYNNEMEKESGSYLRLIHAADIAHKKCGNLLEDAVHSARRLNHSWASIGDILGISRQAAQQRFNPLSEPNQDDDETETRRITGANALNEMALLKVEGKAGNHLVGFGPLFLTVQASEQQWEHKRVIYFSWQDKENLEDKGWQYVGAWLPFHYYKRVITS